MEFFTQNGRVRPVRLSEETRKFAYDSLNRKYGLDTLKNFGISCEEVEGFDELSSLEKYDLAIKMIAEQAPIRICENEKLSGAATLGYAIYHRVPAYKNNDTFVWGISHLTVGFGPVLTEGINGIRKKAEESYKKYKGTKKEAFAKSCLNCLDAFEVWHKRYLDALKDMPQYKANYENLLHVPFEPARNFYEAVQSLWFTFAFLRLCGNWPGIGRIDQMLGGYLKKDLENGTLTLDEAREILSHFFIKGCEWVNGQDVGSGDAQHYQNILLAGVDEEGNEVTNEVTYLVLDIIEEFGISDFPTSVRINKNTDESLLRRVAEAMRFGGGILAVYNEDTVIEALLKDGYELKEARKFANDGCWEVQVPGKTYFIYYPLDSLWVLQHKTLKAYQENLDYSDFESLYDNFKSELRITVDFVLNIYRVLFEGYDEKAGTWVWKEQMPCTMVSLFEEGCIEKGLSYLEGGPVYNIIAPHIGGLADSANALYAIKKLVYDEKKLSLNEFIEVLKNNWENQETLRQYVLNKYAFYGNDNDEVDEIVARVLSDFSDICASFNGTTGFRFPAGVSTFGRQLEWVSQRLASPHGRRVGEVLAANCSPTPSSDKEGATAIVRSYCKADFTKLASGAALDLKLLPSSVDGEDGILALVGLMRGFNQLGGFFMQPDVVDASLLRQAQEHPEDYQTLSVRVSGWNARFVTLNKEWQEMVIEQNEH